MSDSDLDLAEIVSTMLTARTTRALPEAWRGDFSVERANAWIKERDAESPTLLAIETASGRSVGLLIIHNNESLDAAAVDVRIGYLVDDEFRGQGLATELVAGMVDWAQTQPSVRTLTAGVDAAAQASARVLAKNGFERLSDEEDATETYQIRIEHGNRWDDAAGMWDEGDVQRAYAKAAFSSLQYLLSGYGASLLDCRVIDFGCGTGLLTEHLVSAGAAVDGVDTSPAMLAAFDSKITQLGWARVGSTSHLPAATPDYDLVVCSSVLSFVDDYPAAVQDLVLRLRPGGIFVQWDWERVDGDPGGLSRNEIREALQFSGLDEISVDVGFTVSVGDDTLSPLIGYGCLPRPFA